MPPRVARTAIGTIIKRERVKKGVKQGTLATRSGVDQGNISRIERCIVAEPTDETLRKLARGLRIDDPDFFVKQHERRDAAPDSLQSNPETISIGFDFCIWFSSIIGLAGNVPPGIRLSCCERKTDAADGPKIQWIEGNTYDRWWQPSGEEGEDKRTRWNDMKFYYAGDLLSGLKVGRFDSVAVVRGSYENDPNLVRCAEIMVSRRDPDILLVLDESRLHTSDISNLKFEDAWAAFTQISDAPIFYGGEEDAEGIVRQITTALPPNQIQRLHDVHLGLFGSVLEAHIEPLISSHQSFAFVGWQPHIGWLIERAALRPSPYIFKLAAAGAFPGYEEDIYTSVDIVLPRHRIRQWLSDDRLQQFLDAVEQSIHQLRRVGGPPYTLVRKISEYLQIPHVCCDRELKRLRFELRIDPWWYREVRNVMHGQRGSHD